MVSCITETPRPATRLLHAWTAARPARTPRFPPEDSCINTLQNTPVPRVGIPDGSPKSRLPSDGGPMVFGGVQHGALSLIEPALVRWLMLGEAGVLESPKAFPVCWTGRPVSRPGNVFTQNAGYWGSASLNALRFPERVEIALLLGRELRMTLATEMTARDAASTSASPLPAFFSSCAPSWTSPGRGPHSSSVFGLWTLALYGLGFSASQTRWFLEEGVKLAGKYTHHRLALGRNTF